MLKSLLSLPFLLISSQLLQQVKGEPNNVDSPTGNVVIIALVGVLVIVLCIGIPIVHWYFSKLRRQRNRNDDIVLQASAVKQARSKSDSNLMNVSNNQAEFRMERDALTPVAGRR